jgi:dsRNA-specific ribonuclease
MSDHSLATLLTDISAPAFQSFFGAVYISMGLHSCRVLFAELLFDPKDVSSQSREQLQLFWATKPAHPFGNQPSSRLTEKQVRDLSRRSEFYTSSRLSQMSVVSSMESSLKVNFSDKALAFKALLHNSYVANHHLDWLGDNQRLEFLGDSVLQLLVTHMLFDSYPDFDEALITLVRSALVKNSFLSNISHTLGYRSWVQFDFDSHAEYVLSELWRAEYTDSGIV